MTRRIGRCLIGCFGVFALTHCGPGPEGETGTTREAIVNGTVDSSDPAVGLLYVNGSPVCSASLVGRKTVITAAHCVAGGYSNLQFCSQTCTTCSPANCEWGSATIDPSYPLTPGATDFDDDLAVVTLYRDFYTDYGVTPLRLGAAPTSGAAIKLVGFGCTTYSNTNTFGTRNVGYNNINDVNSQNFDYDDTSQAYSCYGDSGGAALLSGTDCEVGTIVGFQDNYFLFVHDVDYVATRLDTKLAWVQSVAADSTVHACGVSVCGDGICQSPETCLSCPQDCGCPIGWLDSANPDGSINGWALDPDLPNNNIQVDVYVSNLSGGPTLLVTTANLPRPDVNAATGYPGNHGFTVQAPSSFWDNQTHAVTAYGVDPEGVGNPELSGCPKNLTLCTGGLTLCSGSCVNLTSNAANCGSCGHSCPNGSCVNGQCTCNGCISGGSCLAGITTSACGSGGQACVACPSGTVCQNHACVAFDCSTCACGCNSTGTACAKPVLCSASCAKAGGFCDACGGCTF